jgi:DNA-binding MarR family transcriptional regulator
MIDRMSNTSRLIEKLRNKGLIDRTECPNDRRKAEIIITPEGLEMVEKTSLIIDAKMSGKLDVLTQEEVQTLNNLLNKLNQ